MKYSYDYPRPMVTTDTIIINKRENNIYILLIKRLNAPYKNCWAFPGGFVNENEALPKAAKRELEEETSVISNELKQFKAYGDPGRDPRGHNICVVFYDIITNKLIEAKAGDDAKETKWFPIDQLPDLAFDHEKIVNEFIQKKL